jgi:hypothetical protein
MLLVAWSLVLSSRIPHLQQDGQLGVPAQVHHHPPHIDDLKFQPHLLQSLTNVRVPTGHESISLYFQIVKGGRRENANNLETGKW